jgi:hypothetical protein
VHRGLASLFALAVLAAPLSAQDGGGGIRINVPSSQSRFGTAPSVVSGNLLGSGDTRELLRSGFPARLHYRLELWRESGWFDDREGTTEWDVFVHYDPSSEVYKAVRRHGAKSMENFGEFVTLTGLEEVLSRPYSVALRPQRGGARYYYSLAIDVEAMSLSDLDELNRWLKGELQPAVQGKNNPAAAIKNGLGTLLTRVLGGEKRRYVRRSETFKN